MRQQWVPLPQRSISFSLKGGSWRKGGSMGRDYVEEDARTKLKWPRMWVLKNSPLLKLFFSAAYVSAGTF